MRREKFNGFVVFKKYHDTSVLRELVGEEGIEVVSCCKTLTAAKKTMRMLGKKPNSQSEYSVVVMNVKEFSKKHPKHLSH